MERTILELINQRRYKLRNFKMLKNNKYSRLTVLYDFRNTEKPTGEQHYCHCLCSCGKEVDVYAGCLVSGGTKSCGCLNIESAISYNTTHGFCLKTATPEMKRFYHTYRGMVNRCTDPCDHRYKKYSVYGICDEWKNSFIIFKNDMWTSFQEHQLKFGMDTEIERIDNNKSYCKENCRWATRKEQMNNTSKSHFIEYKGERHTVAEWSDILNIKYYVLTNRIRRGWTTERMFETIV